MSIKKIYDELRYHNSLGFLIALMVHKIYIFFKYRLFGNRFYILQKFKTVFGYELDLSLPKTLNEKIQWYKLNYKIPLIVQCADKYAVREYVAKFIGEKYLVPLVFHTTDYKEIKSENLPDYPFIIKANHTAGTHNIVREKNKVNWNRIQTDCRWWLHLNYHHMEKEWQYKKIRPRIVVEKLLTDSSGKIPSDYKLHYFNGKFEFLQVDLDRARNHKRNLYDKDWNLLPFTWSVLDDNKHAVSPNGRELERPNNLELLIKLGKNLAEPFPYVRVDFYNLNGEIYFGELTFHHGGGFQQFTPSEWDLYFGKKVPLKTKQHINKNLHESNLC